MFKIFVTFLEQLDFLTTVQSYLAWICCFHPANDFMYEYVEAILLIIQESHQIKEYRVTITDDFVQSSLAVKLYQFTRPPFHTQNKEIALALKKSLVNSKYGYKPLYPVKHRRQNKKNPKHIVLLLSTFVVYILTLFQRMLA